MCASLFPEAAEEFFEYDAEEFLVSLTLLITEGRTPECSVKGRTEGLHCPPAQSGGPVLTKHECSDKLPQVKSAAFKRHITNTDCSLRKSLSFVAVCCTLTVSAGEEDEVRGHTAVEKSHPYNDRSDAAS